jgi:hypothetical protein
MTAGTTVAHRMGVRGLSGDNHLRLRVASGVTVQQSVRRVVVICAGLD